ncbi:hypothetical protein BH10PSE15_BH10PSE15_13490 [soil metagenome]
MASWNDDPDKFHFIVRSMLTTDELSAEDQATVTARIQKLFAEICALPACKIKMGSVAYVKAKPENLNTQDVVVHLVSSKNASILKKYKGLPVSADPNAAGRTLISDNGNIAEVYKSAPYNNEPELLANMLVHESMHNKLNMDDAALHGEATFVGEVGGFCQEELPRATELKWSGDDRRLLGPNLHKEDKQQVY